MSDGVKMDKVYLAASILMAVGGVLMLPAREFLTAAAMLTASGLTAELHRAHKRGVGR